VTSEADGAVFVADLGTKKVAKSVKVGPRPRSIAFTPDGAAPTFHRKTEPRSRRST
jgi:YVTN family beta-propeller protein